MTPAVAVGLRATSSRRMASIRSGASAYGWVGASGRAARSSAAAGAGADPLRFSLANVKLWKIGVSKTPATVARSASSCWGSENCGPTPSSPHATARSTRAAPAAVDRLFKGKNGTVRLRKRVPGWSSGGQM